MARTQDEVFIDIVTKTDNAVRGFAELSAAIGASVAAVSRFFRGVNELIDESTKAQHAQVQLAAALKATGNAVGVSSDEMASMAGELSSVLAIEDDLIVNTQALMVTFTQVGREVFPDAIKAAADMSAMFGQDLQQSVVQLGTALNDPIQGIGRLRRIGVSFTESQRQSIQAFMDQNDVMGAQQVILAELNREFGGVAEAMAGVNSQQKQFALVMGNIKEEGGRLLRDWLDPTLALLTIWGNKIYEVMRGMKLWKDEISDLGKTMAELEFGDTATISYIVEMVGKYRDVIKEGGENTAQARAELAGWLNQALLFGALPDEVALYNAAMNQALSLQAEFLTPERTLDQQIEELGLLRNELRALGFDTTALQTIINALAAAAADAGTVIEEKYGNKIKALYGSHKDATISAMEFGDQIRRNVEIANEMAAAMEPIITMHSDYSDAVAKSAEDAAAAEKDAAGQATQAWLTAFSDVATANKKLVAFQKAAALAQVAYNTAVAISEALKIPIYGELKAIAVGISGAAQAAAILSQSVPSYGTGGLVTQPTLALVGERGPERITPLTGGSSGNTLVLNIGGTVQSEDNLRGFVAQTFSMMKRGW